MAELRFSKVMQHTRKSIIREILKVTEDKEMISFAGGLPNPISFPVMEIEKATERVLRESGNEALQYSTTEGYLPLREFIAKRYLDKKGIVISPEEILITNGSQQALDLIGKIFLDQGDPLVIEKPGYLGAIQSLSFYQPEFVAVEMDEEGVKVEELQKVLQEKNPKLFYGVPNFQNPSGLTYSKQRVKEVAEVIKNSNTVFIEDNPYGELRFMGEEVPSLKTYLGDQCILLGSFSKIVSPGMRLGWVCAPKEIMEKLVIAKQATDLHTNYFSQRVLHEYLSHHDLDSHIEKIRTLYRSQRNMMVSAIEKYFPKQVELTKPEGGMFLWVTLPEGCDSMELLTRALERKVAFVPGESFYSDASVKNTLRLNYTNSTEEMIRIGIQRVAEVIQEDLYEKGIEERVAVC